MTEKKEFALFLKKKSYFYSVFLSKEGIFLVYYQAKETGIELAEMEGWLTKWWYVKKSPPGKS